MAVTYHAGNIIRGTTADRTGGTWTNLPSGWIFIESTGPAIYRWNGTTWDLIANNEVEIPFSQLIYKAGTTIKRMNGSTKIVESSGTVADVQIQAAIDALGNDSGKTLFIKNSAGGIYSITATLNFSAINGNCHIVGEHNTGCNLRPSGDFPVFTITGKTAITMEHLFLTHTQSGYTSSLLRLENVGSCSFNDLQFYDGGQQKGTAIGLDSTTGAVQANYFNNCRTLGFEQSIFGNVPNTTYYINGNYFMGCKFWTPIKALALNTVASSAFDNNNFIGCEGQALGSTTTVCGWDYETNHLGHSFYTTHAGCIFWDLHATRNYALVNTTTELNLLGCIPDYKISGAGVGNGKILRFSTYSVKQGEATFSGDGSTTAFAVTHNLATTPTHAVITPTTTGAIGGYVSAYSSTTFTVTFPIAPPTGTSNIKFTWRASIT